MINMQSSYDAQTHYMVRIQHVMVNSQRKRKPKTLPTPICHLLFIQLFLFSTLYLFFNFSFITLNPHLLN